MTKLARMAGGIAALVVPFPASTKTDAECTAAESNLSMLQSISEATSSSSDVSTVKRTPSMKTLCRVYDSYPQAERAYIALEIAGVPSSAISLVANRHASVQTSPIAKGAGLGAAVGSGAGLLAGIGLIAVSGLGPVVAAGWITTIALGTVAGSAAGGLIGALVRAGTSEDDADVYSEIVRRGGILVTVRHNEPNGKIERILDASNQIDSVSRRDAYEHAGWEQLDPKALGLSAWSGRYRAHPSLGQLTHRAVPHASEICHAQ